MSARPVQILALRHEEHFEKLTRSMVTLPAAPMARIGVVESIMLGWWLRRGPYPVGAVFGSWMPGRG